ncbi:MAG: precorrin-2 dehydrogenase / sirohydrochlorin ferrochelatase [Gemmatimonadetes bacterium]|nr:precorrin-2 dehydrogenase / sirohydrochlorin ferrochelatase [Gemmatimonadota bacterium]
MLEGERVTALVVGGGAVATRKVRALVESGAAVRVVAPRVTLEMRTLVAGAERVRLLERGFNPADVDSANLVFAATDDRVVNAEVARAAGAAGRWVNVADAPDEGTFSTAAVHRSGDLVIAVSAGGVPAAAARVRDAIAARFDARYAHAVRALGAMRRALLDRGDRARWQQASDALAGESFCESVEQGRLDAEVTRWA